MNKEVYSRTRNTKDNWETPDYFFNLINEEFKFTLDPCATKQNTKCKNFYSQEDNGLKKDWKGARVFVNPPFSNIGKWVKKCYEEGIKENTVVVLIIPSRTDTKYWHDYVMKANEIWFCKGRVNFLQNRKKPENGSTFPLSVIIFRSFNLGFPKIKPFCHKNKEVSRS